MKSIKYILFVYIALLLFSLSSHAQSEWKDSELKKYSDIVKNIWGIFNTFKSIGEFFCPGTSMDDIIDAIENAKNEILDKIDEQTAWEANSKAAGYLEQYRQWLDNPTQERWQDLIGDGPDVQKMLELLIKTGSPYASYLTCVSYNLFVPAYLTVRLRNGDSEKDIERTINEAIETNKILLGPYCSWSSNFPLYDWMRGKILRYYFDLYPNPSQINQTVLKEIDQVLDFVWTSNESLRVHIIPDYQNYLNSWFTICLQSSSDIFSFEANYFRYGYLHVPSGTSEVLLGNPKNINDALWSFKFHGCRYFNLIHKSGNYLYVDRTKWQTVDELIMKVIPENNSAFQKWTTIQSIDEYYQLKNELMIGGEFFVENSTFQGWLGLRLSDSKVIFLFQYGHNLYPEGCEYLNFNIDSSIKTYVNYNTYFFQTGTSHFPWNTVKEGVDWIVPGGDVLIAPANYNENIVINKKCNLIRYGSSGSVIIGKQ